MEFVPWGGSEVLWSSAATVLTERGHHVIASVKFWPNAHPELTRLENHGVQVHFRKKPKRTLLGRVVKKLKRGNTQKGTMPPEEAFLRSLAPDLVCVSDGGVLGAMPWLTLCNQLEIPYVALSQANSEQWWPNDDRVDPAREAFREAQKCFFVSHANRSLFERQIATALPNAEIVRNPFNVPWDEAPAWPATTNADDRWKLACVGRLEPNAKGQDLIVDVLTRPFWKETPLQVSFYGAGVCESGLRRLVSENGLDDRIRFAGHVHDIREIWASHHALILASRYEGLPLAVVEAMLCNRPVIATAVAGIPEVVEHGVNGFLADAPTTPLLDTAMRSAWDARHQWETMGRVAGESIRNEVPRDPAIDFANRLEAVVRNRTRMVSSGPVLK